MTDPVAQTVLRRRVGYLISVVTCSFCLGSCAASSVTVAPSPAETDRTEIVSCCADPERYPNALVAIVDAGAPVFGRLAAAVVFRPGYLSGEPEVEKHLRSVLRPLDLVITSSRGRLSSRLIPGRFSHLAIYLGSEAELKRLGIWQHPDVVPYHDDISAGATLIEAVSEGVRLSSPEIVFSTDEIVVLRPRLPTIHRRREAVLHLYQHIGTEFDFHFDVDEKPCQFCTELADHVFPELNLPIRRVYDRSMILPDEITTEALNGTSPLVVETYVRGTSHSWEIAPSAVLAETISSAWQTETTPPRPDPCAECQSR